MGFFFCKVWSASVTQEEIGKSLGTAKKRGNGEGIKRIFQLFLACENELGNCND